MANNCLLTGLLPCCPALTALDLCRTAMSGSAVSELCQLVPGLKGLNLSGLFVVDDDMNDITRHVPKLEVLNLAGSDKLTDRTVDTLSVNCPMLKALTLTLHHDVVDEDGKMRIKTFPGDGLCAFARSCVHLQQLTLYGGRMLPDALVVSLVHVRAGLELKLPESY
eukprot:TRINITY_DN3672_c0_g1_i1.p1 TRINITY_DN3672_c0_g1~~TRINITY_DN3672_c0_g1_i1.p1  ORF type:complete len:166 (+),score=29.27 TRINITY_DN3672_c0_g1_i1:188-685(+)